LEFSKIRMSHGNGFLLGESCARSKTNDRSWCGGTGPGAFKRSTKGVGGSAFVSFLKLDRGDRFERRTLSMIQKVGHGPL
jgi:hypothetical protein